MTSCFTEKSRDAWEVNAAFWDDYMGDSSNKFHREVVRPRVNRLLDVKDGDFVLDIACGNGNYSAYMADLGARVVAFDYSEKMIERAKLRRHDYLDRVEFCVADATSESELLALKRDKPFDKAVSNMAVMDITDIDPLFRSVSALLKDGGVFVFATQHPCFVTLTDKYLTPHSYSGEAIPGQPVQQRYYHRSLQDIFALCFQNGFVVDGFLEGCYDGKEKPEIIVVSAVKRS